MPEREGRIILVRHGETEANRLGCFADSDDISLTDVGREQAEMIARTIQQAHRPGRVFSSHFRRARQTAEIIARRLGLTEQTWPGLHERDFGSLKGKPYHQMGRLMEQDQNYKPERRWLWAPPNGESLSQVQKRTLNALRAIGFTCPAEEVVVVTHGAVMESITAHLCSDWSKAAVPRNCASLLIDLSAL